MMNTNCRRIVVVLLGVGFVFLLGEIYYHAVDNSLSSEDKEYIEKYLVESKGIPQMATYEDELEFIVAVQRAVLTIAPGMEGIPLGHKREPRDLYEAKTGLCFDRSRVIEKVLRYAGFDARHVFILSKKNTGSAIKALIAAAVSSHAVTEVATKNGWLIVDSNAPWVSTDINGQPISIHEMQYQVENSMSIRWRKEPPAGIYGKPFTFVYGLYSRHGRFYPPYDFIPDVNYGELLQNIL